MIWFIVLPIQITLVLSVGIIVLVYLVARRKHTSRLMSTFSATLVAGVAFVPLSIMVYFAISPFRFGEFHAADTTSVRFAKVTYYLPPSATDIDMITTPQHHFVRFCVTEKQLLTWMKRLWEVEGEHSPMPRSEAAFGVLTKGCDSSESVKLGFAKLGMNLTSVFMYFEGPYQTDWGGPTLWYNASSETAWQHVGYW